MADSPSIQVKNLSYKFQDGSSGLSDVSLDLPAGSRTLLIGGMYSALYLQLIMILPLLEFLDG
jgi:ABC-type arginine transport system ATPase subunit